MLRYCLLLLFTSIYTITNAQSCCSGGVPLSNNLGLPSAQTGITQLRLSYDYNNLNTLKSGWERLEDDSRQRLSHTILLSWGLSLSKKWAIEGLLSYIWQERKIIQDVGIDVAQTNGLADAVFLIHYNIWTSTDNSSHWRIALGSKLPFGDFNQTDHRGLVLNAELQPGSGAYDAILWTQWTQSLNLRPSMTFNATTAYSYKGKNKRYLVHEIYQFGKEWQLSVSLTDRLLIHKNLVDLGLNLRYRLAAADVFNQAVLPATGGQWLFVQPSIALWLSPDFSLDLNGNFPLLAQVTDTQFSPTIRLNVGLFYRFALWKQQKNEFSSFRNKQ